MQEGWGEVRRHGGRTPGGRGREGGEDIQPFLPRPMPFCEYFNRGDECPPSLLLLLLLLLGHELSKRAPARELQQGTAPLRRLGHAELEHTALPHQVLGIAGRRGAICAPTGISSSLVKAGGLSEPGEGVQFSAYLYPSGPRSRGPVCGWTRPARAAPRATMRTRHPPSGGTRAESSAVVKASIQARYHVRLEAYPRAHRTSRYHAPVAP